MLDIIADTLIDGIKMLPFLFISYLIIEFVEHRSSEKLEKALSKSGKYGPIAGAVLGLLPQCGFSVTASNLFSGRVITLGTLIAVFLATSDEAIPVLLSHPENIGSLVLILLVKFVIAFLAGFLIDFFLRKKHSLKEEVEEVHEHMHEMCRDCDCEHGIFHSAVKHTINIFIFVILVSFVLNCVIAMIGEENLSKVLMSGSILQPFVASIIGLIPNCASSVLLTELYIAGNISFASIIAGLCTGSGIGLAVLFKMNKNMKENFKILGIVYGIGVASGIVLELLGFLLK